MTEDVRSRLGAERLAAEKRRHRHRWEHRYIFQGQELAFVCLCGAIKDEAKTIKGRNNRRRGNDYERSIASRLGIKRVGQYGAPEDVKGDHMVIQVKVGGAFPERYWRWLSALTAEAGQLRAVVIGDAPGTGSKRREVIVLDFGDFIDWFGKEGK